jgi:DNA recombination protein RmuC
MIYALIVAGTLLGVVVGWYLAAGRARAAGGRVEDELRQQLRAREDELAALRTEFTRLIASESRARADAEAAGKLLADRESQFERRWNESHDAQEKALAGLREAFRAMSADALQQNAPEFLRLAREAFGTLQESARGDLEKRQEAIAGLLKPLEEQLRAYQQRLQQSESAQALALGEVRMQLETLGLQSQSLATETERFRMVLRSNQARGRWGEETLRRVVEAAGMSAHCDFVEQSVEEDRKPDMVVRLPGNRVIIVDAKVPDIDFISALDTADMEKRSSLLKSHALKLKDTIRDLARRNYPQLYENALDYVVLFLPAESLFSAALEGDNGLIVWAANNKIMLATPASLIALLRSVSVSWQQYAQSENAREISRTAKELFTRMATFIEHFDKIHAGLKTANEAYDKAVRSYDRMVRPCGEKMMQLGVDSGPREWKDLRELGEG